MQLFKCICSNDINDTDDQIAKDQNYQIILISINYFQTVFIITVIVANDQIANDRN